LQACPKTKLFAFFVTTLQDRNDIGLFMYFCDSNREITQIQKEEKEQHQRVKLIAY